MGTSDFHDDEREDDDESLEGDSDAFTGEDDASELDTNFSYYGVWRRRREAEGFAPATAGRLKKFGFTLQRDHVYLDSEAQSFADLARSYAPLADVHRELDVFAADWASKWRQRDASIEDQVAAIRSGFITPATCLMNALRGPAAAKLVSPPRFTSTRINAWSKEVRTIAAELEQYCEKLDGFRRRGRSWKVVLKHQFIYAVDALYEYFDDDERGSFLNQVDDEHALADLERMVLLLSKRIFHAVDPEAKGVQFSRELVAFRRFENFHEFADIGDARWHRLKVQLFGADL